MDSFSSNYYNYGKESGYGNTNFNMRKDDLVGETSIIHEHMRNNADVWGLLSKRGIKPEELPAEEDIQKLSRKVKKTERNLSRTPKLSSKK